MLLPLSLVAVVVIALCIPRDDEMKKWHAGGTGTSSMLNPSTVLGLHFWNAMHHCCCCYYCCSWCALGIILTIRYLFSCHARRVSSAVIAGMTSEIWYPPAVTWCNAFFREVHLLASVHMFFFCHFKLTLTQRNVLFKRRFARTHWNTRWVVCCSLSGKHVLRFLSFTRSAWVSVEIVVSDNSFFVAIFIFYHFYCSNWCVSDRNVFKDLAAVLHYAMQFFKQSAQVCQCSCIRLLSFQFIKLTLILQKVIFKDVMHTFTETLDELVAVLSVNTSHTFFHACNLPQYQ